MFYPLSLALGLRYTRAKQRNHFISFISWVSLGGIALGVMVLITVLSVMNGFDREIKTRMLDMVPQVSLTGANNTLNHWQDLAKALPGQDHIVAVAPFIQGEGMITSTTGSPAFSVLQGIDPHLQPEVSPIASKMLTGQLSSLNPQSFHIILGVALAESLGVTVGDAVTVYVPKASFSPAGIQPRLRQFTVSGIFQTGYQYDNNYALINITDAAALLQMGSQVSGLQLKLDDLFRAEQVSNDLSAALPGYYASTWISQNANFFAALHMEKLMMSVILLLIIAVAAFNMLASLVMLVTDKKADIAILKTMGMPTRDILKIFMIQGFIVGCLGTLLGVVSGVILALNITALVTALQNLLHIQFLNSNIYYIDFLPSYLEWPDVLIISGIALLFSLLATIYPAVRASKINPVEALRYE